MFRCPHSESVQHKPWRLVADRPQHQQASLVLRLMVVVVLAPLQLVADEPGIEVPSPDSAKSVVLPAPQIALGEPDDSTKASDKGSGKPPMDDNSTSTPLPPMDRPLKSIRVSVATSGESKPPSPAALLMAKSGTHGVSIGDTRNWMMESVEWDAPATCHLPLLFEEPNLERLGYRYGTYFNCCDYETGDAAAEWVQPFVSGVRFFGRIPLIPYNAGVDPLCDPIYTLGVDRPGSPVPYRKHMVPLSLKGGLYQAGAIVGLVFFIP